MRPLILSPILFTGCRAISWRSYTCGSCSLHPPSIPLRYPRIVPRSTPIPSFSIHRTGILLHTAQTKATMSSSPIPDRYKLVFFVPHAHVDVCKDAVFDVGAGTFPGGKYTKCCFQMPGKGQFMPSDGANPAIGAVGALEYVEEMKVEVICVGRSIMLNAVEALKKAHPYEEVAYEVYKMENV